MEEERLRLKEKVRKLAKLASTKGNIASIIGDDFDLNLEQSKDLINSKLKDLDSKYVSFYLIYLNRKLVNRVVKCDKYFFSMLFYM